MEPYWEQIKQIVRESDIVLEILDARAIEISRNDQLEKILKETSRPTIFVVNKSDLVGKRDLEASMEELRSRLKSEVPGEEPYVVYVSNRSKKTVRNLIAVIRKIFAKYGKRKDFYKQPILAKPYREAKGDMIIGVVGYPNVGKSSIINALAFKKKVQVSSKAGTTHGVHWISVGDNIKLIDTPGVIPLAYSEEAKLGIISAKSVERLKDSETVALRIIEQFVKEGKESLLEEFYKFKIDAEDKSNAAIILEKLAIAKKHLRRGGLPDDARAAVMLVRDWQNGLLKL